MAAKVSFNYADRKLPLNEKRFIKKFIECIFLKEKKKLEYLKYVFCSDDYLLKINVQFLHHNFYTDIISFNLSSNEKTVKGEIYVSIDRAKENYHKYKTSLQEEFLRVIFHGALHLCGYKDKSPPEKKTMRRKEDFYITMFHVKQTEPV
jgi:probable rRNA maturation factor